MSKEWIAQRFSEYEAKLAEFKRQSTLAGEARMQYGPKIQEVRAAVQSSVDELNEQFAGRDKTSLKMIDHGSKWSIERAGDATLQVDIETGKGTLKFEWAPSQGWPRVEAKPRLNGLIEVKPNFEGKKVSYLHNGEYFDSPDRAAELILDAVAPGPQDFDIEAGSSAFFVF